MTPNCSTAAAAASSLAPDSGELNHSSSRTPRVGGKLGPRIRATSTADEAKTITAKTGKRISPYRAGATLSSHAAVGECPRVRASATRRGASKLGSRASEMNSRKGISFKVRPATKAKPRLSLGNSTSGGVCHCISEATARLTTPVGDSRTSRPNAAAAWGIASTGAANCEIQRPSLLPCVAARKRKTLASEAAGVSRPATRLTTVLRAIPGVTNS